jgi:CRISPR system Cascade subunit CasA
MFPGLPEGTNACFFNEVGEVTKACPACTALALFHQASNCPNWSGKHKGGLRGGSPVTVFVHDDDLRHYIWKNVLNTTFAQKHFPQIPPAGYSLDMRWARQYGAAYPVRD